MLKKELLRQRRHTRVRHKVEGTMERPRLVVYRSLKSIYAQLVDDQTGKTLASASDIKVKTGTKMERAKTVGTQIAEKGLEKKVQTCVFDRNGYKYHGRVKALAEAAREAGLKF